MRSLLPLVYAVAVLWSVAACARGTRVTPTATPFRARFTLTVPPTPTPTPMATPEPVAAVVNGQAILIREWKAETARLLQAAQARGTSLSPNTVQALALAYLVDETLLAQAAIRAGYRPSEQAVNARIAALLQAVGGPEAFRERLQALGYPDEAAFRQALQRAMAATWMRNHILQSLPETVEQVEVRQILRYRQDEAQAIYAQLQAGKDFLALAFAYDPQTGGYLGWMPRKVWPTRELEDAVFALEPGHFTPVIATPLGYHIVYLIRKARRPLPAWAWRIWAQDALATWIQQARAQARIEIQVVGVTLPPPEGAAYGAFPTATP